MIKLNEHFIGAQWQAARGDACINLFNPATGAIVGSARMGSPTDALAGVQAAKAALPAMAASTRQQRLDLLAAIQAAFEARKPDLAQTIEQELGAPRALVQQLHVPVGLLQLQQWRSILYDFSFTQSRHRHQLVQHPVGVCALISSWNYPINGPLGVLLPALVAGCPVVWKPSEYALRSGRILAEIFASVGLPDGAFNMVMGDAAVGQTLVGAADVAMVSFTGSVGVGRQVAAQAGAAFKRTVMELGGKSPFIVLPGANVQHAVQRCAQAMFMNTGQSCNAPSRLLVPRSELATAKAVAKAVAEAVVVGPPEGAGVNMGPVGHAQHDRALQEFITQGVRQGSELVAGGPGRPQGLNQGYYVRPTVFVADRDAHVSRHEAFGPVLTLLGYHDVAEAIAIANDSKFGLSAYVVGPSAAEVAVQLQAGMVHVNGAVMDLGMPFGGLKQSGIGRKFGPEGLAAYLEVQSVLMPNPAGEAP